MKTHTQSKRHADARTECGMSLYGLSNECLESITKNAPTCKRCLVQYNDNLAYKTWRAAQTTKGAGL